MRPFALAALVALAPAGALAHEGHHEQMSALLIAYHALTQPDHLLAIGGLAALAAVFGWRWTRQPAKVRIRK